MKKHRNVNKKWKLEINEILKTSHNKKLKLKKIIKFVKIDCFYLTS